MPTLRPFRGLRYSEKAGPLGDLICPHSVSPDSVLYENPFQAVHLVSPKRESDDRSKFVAFARAMAALALWRREGILELEPEACWYRWQLGTADLWIGLARITELKEQSAERKEVESRLRRLEATRLHVEFPLFQSQSLPEISSEETLFEGFSKVQLVQPWAPDLTFVSGASALEAARAHAINLGDRVVGRGEEWVPIAVFTGTLDPVSELPLFREAQIGDHSENGRRFPGGEAASQDKDLAAKIHSGKGAQNRPDLWAGWLLWCHGDHVRVEGNA